MKYGIIDCPDIVDVSHAVCGVRDVAGAARQMFAYSVVMRSAVGLGDTSEIWRRRERVVRLPPFRFGRTWNRGNGKNLYHAPAYKVSG